MPNTSILLTLSMLACGETKPEETDTGLDPIEEPSGEPSGEPSTEETGDTDDTDTQETDTQDPDDADQDGDGYSVNDGDCNDLDASQNLTDADGDGQSTCNGDCNDLDATVFDGAEEVCDGQVNDCAGSTVQPTEIPESELDGDGDGYAVCDNDCDDDNDAAFPGAAYNESATACMIDADGDGYGEDLGSTATGGCCYVFDMEDSWGDGWNGASLAVNVNGSLLETLTLPDAGLINQTQSSTETVCVTNGDTVEAVFTSGSYDNEITLSITDPEGAQVYSGTEPTAGVLYSGNAVCENTEAVTTSGTDCDDDNSAAYPGATEVWYNGVDEDCGDDVAGDYDQDGDGQSSNQYGGQDCNDTNPNVYTGAVEDTTDGIDNNCNGDIDEGFVIQTIATNVSYTNGQPMTIDVDSYGFVHIAYAQNGDIKYVSNSTGSWGAADTAPTDSSASSGLHLKGVVDGIDRFHITYTATVGSDHDVNYMNVNTINGSWSSELNVTTAATGTLTDEFRVDMAVDNFNLPSIVWYNQVSEEPMLLDVSNTSNLDGIVSILDHSYGGFGYTGSYASVAIDNSNRNHAVFYNNVLGLENQYNQVENQATSRNCADMLGFIEQDSTSAFIEQDGDGINNDIAIKPYSNKAGVAYMDAVNTDLMYAYNTTGGCGGWTSQQVDGSNNGEYISLVYTSDDHPYIAYYSGQYADLKVAYYDGASWTYELVDEYGDIGKYVDMAIDGNDMLHIVYYDDTTNSIKYAMGQL